MRAVICAFVLCWMSSISCAQIAEATQSNILDKLEFHDSEFLEALVIEGVVLHPPAIGNVGFPHPPRKFVLTLSQAELAMMEEAVSDPVVTYIAESSDSEAVKAGQLTYDDEGVMRFGMETKMTTYFGSAKSGKHKRTTVFALAKNGKVLSREHTDSYAAYRPDSETLALWHNKTLWSLGRCYRRFLHSLVKVEVNDSGQLEILAKGSFSENAPPNGEWLLTVEPESNYLVRSAKFYIGTVSSGGSAFAEVSCDGINKSNDVFYPKEGKFLLPPFGLTSYQYESCEFRTDSSVLLKAKQGVDGSTVGRRSILIDNRQDPPKIVVNGMRDTAPVSRRSRWLLIVFAGITLLGVMVFALGKRSQSVNTK